MTTRPAAPIMDAQSMNTRNFLVDFNIDEKLMKQNMDVPEKEYSQSDVEIEPVVPDYKDLDSYQIRTLLIPDQHVNVLVLDVVLDDGRIIVPFSKFVDPATNEEMRVGDRNTDGSPCILQFWNARSMHNMLLRQSLLVDKLSDEEIRQVDEFYESEFLGEGEPDMSRSGTRIIQIDDPRIRYKRRSLAIFAKVDAMDMLLTEMMGEASAETYKNFQYTECPRIVDTSMNIIEYLRVFNRTKRKAFPILGVEHKTDSPLTIPENLKLKSMKDVLFFDMEQRRLVGYGYADVDGIVLETDESDIVDNRTVVILCEPVHSDNINE